MIRHFSRRQFIKSSAVAVTAAGALVTAGKFISDSANADFPNPYPVLPDKKAVIPPPSAPLLFFNEHQYYLVAAISALVVPEDESPGATETGVAGYIDRMVSGSEKNQKRYATGLKWIDTVSRDQYGGEFLDLDIKEQIELLIAIDEAESRVYRPVFNLIERVDRKIDDINNKIFGLGDIPNFFKAIRKDVFYAHYSNPVTWKALGYYGPPQPLGYLDYTEPPASEKYLDIVRPMNDKPCRNCHYDELAVPDHEEQDDCLECHDPHSPIREYMQNG